MLQDDVLHQGVDQRLQGDDIVIMSPSYQAGAKAHSQVVRLHHVLVTVLRHAGGRGTQNWTMTERDCFKS